MRGLHRGGLGEGGGAGNILFITPSNSLPARRSDRMQAALQAAFSPELVIIRDDSAHHAGHSGAGTAGQSHYSVLMVAAAFRGVSRVARSRAVHAALADEFGPAEAGGMHALALTLRTPEEHAAIGG